MSEVTEQEIAKMAAENMRALADLIDEGKVELTHFMQSRGFDRKPKSPPSEGADFIPTGVRSLYIKFKDKEK